MPIVQLVDLSLLGMLVILLEFRLVVLVVLQLVILLEFRLAMNRFIKTVNGRCIDRDCLQA